jgi:hypothetical protein
LVAELFFDPQQLVVLAHPIGPAGRARLDLARRRADREVGDRRIFGFARAVRDDRGVLASRAIMTASSVSVTVPI